MSKLSDTRGSNSGSFPSTGLKFGSFTAKELKSKTVSRLFKLSHFNTATFDYKGTFLELRKGNTKVRKQGAHSLYLFDI